MAASPLGRLKKESQDSLWLYARSVLDRHRRSQQELFNKMSIIDIAYARYKVSQAASDDGSGTDVRAGETECGVILDDMTVPIVASQVDTHVAYLADVYLSGYPIFPVLSGPQQIAEASAMEAMVDTHATIGGGYARQLLKAFHNGMRYNFMPLFIEWDYLPMYKIASSYLKPTEKAKAEKSNLYYNKITAGDPYNTVWDDHVSPADLSFKGEYGGEISIVSRVELKRKMANYMAEGISYNVSKALNFNTTSALATAGQSSHYYKDRPQISDYINTSPKKAGMYSTWMDWLNSRSSSTQRAIYSYSDSYEYFHLYARIIPSEHYMDVPEPNTPQIWQLDFIIPGQLIAAKRVITAYEMLPMLIGQPMEDGYDLQTQSLAEKNIDFQEGASKLINIRFAAARRAISDRALYDPNLIRPSDINNPVAAPKIPVNIPLTSQKTIGDAYEQIPYTMAETNGLVSDSRLISAYADELSGSNKGMQGQPIKGNKTRKEWDDVQGAAANRMRLSAICLEYQVFVPVKEQIKLNIVQFGEAGVFQNFKTGETVEVTPELLDKVKKSAMSFKIADGYTPSAKMINPEIIQNGMQIIQSSPVLQVQLGTAIAPMFAHMMNLAGVPGLDQYIPQQPQGATNVGPTAAGQPVTVPVPGQPGSVTTGAPA